MGCFFSLLMLLCSLLTSCAQGPPHISEVSTGNPTILDGEWRSLKTQHIYSIKNGAMYLHKHGPAGGHPIGSIIAKDIELVSFPIFRGELSTYKVINMIPVYEFVHGEIKVANNGNLIVNRINNSDELKFLSLDNYNLLAAYIPNLKEKVTHKETSTAWIDNNEHNKVPSNSKLNISFNKPSNNQYRRISDVAVIIGNRNYSPQKQNVPDVDFAHNDADLIKRYVVEGLGYREGNVIDLRDATQANLISVFGNKENHKGQIFSWIRPGESDVFVYYSGHGAPGLSNGQGYLLPVDANPNTVELNGYPLETLYANLGKLPAKSLTVVIDACFSGSSQAGSVVKNASAISLKRVDTKTNLPNATILTAAGLSEVASWDEEAKLGLFTRHFLEGVTGKADQDKFGNGDGQVTLGELKNYLESEVTYMARRLYMREQHPQVSGNQSDILIKVN